MTSSGTFKTRKQGGVSWLIDQQNCADCRKRFCKSCKKTQRFRFVFKPHLSAWPSHSRPYTPVDCPPSGSTRPLWLAASYTRCTRSSVGDRRNPALSAPPDSAGCPADTPHTSSRTSCTANEGSTVRCTGSTDKHVECWEITACSTIHAHA